MRFFSQLNRAPGLPLKSVCRAIPLPSVAQHCGTTLVMQADSFPLFRDMFRHTGVCLPVADDRELNVLMTVSSTMGPFYYTLAAMRDYVTSQGHYAIEIKVI